jgi:hypothetical protein
MKIHKIHKNEENTTTEGLKITKNNSVKTLFLLKTHLLFYLLSSFDSS